MWHGPLFSRDIYCGAYRRRSVLLGLVLCEGLGLGVKIMVDCDGEGDAIWGYYDGSSPV